MKRDIDWESKDWESKEPATFKVAEAAEILGIHPLTAYALAKTGELPGARRLGRRIVVSRKALRDFLDGKDAT